MKIAIPVDENRVETEVCVSFGRAPYFMLYDTEAAKAEYLVNTAAEAQSGAGLEAAQLVADSGAGALITVRCGENAAEVLSAAEVKIYKSDSPAAGANLAAYQEGKLALLTKFHGGFHGHT